MTQINSQCSLCQHFRVFNREADTCAAYPTGIPRRILENKLDHRRPIAGDRGIRWKFNPEAGYLRHPLAERTLLNDEEGA